MHDDIVSGPAEQSPIICDVDQLLDQSEWGPLQTRVIWTCGLAIILDGVNIQLFGVAIPALMRDWKLPTSAFAPVLASGLLGMMLGGAVAGLLGDTLGRRFALISSACLFGVATLASSFASSLVMLSILRFFAGFGLQGATPNGAALVSEYVPKRLRSLAVTLVVVCIPLGATLAGLIAIPLLPAAGWRGLFAIGGVIPILVSVALVQLLPESPRYLVRRRDRWHELTVILIRLGHCPAEHTQYGARQERQDGSVAQEVLGASIRHDTFALWASFFFCLLAVYASTNWIPTVLTQAGLQQTVVSLGVMVLNLGGVVGALGGALSVSRLGSKPTMLAMAAGAGVGALVMTTMKIEPQGAAIQTMVMLGLTGGLINGLQVAMYSLATSLYPTTARATGVGAASSIGRVGAILSPYAGNWAIESGGASMFFCLLATAMILAFVSLSLIRRHTPPVSRRPLSL